MPKCSSLVMVVGRSHTGPLRGRGHGEVGGDGIRQEALIQRLLDHPEIEVAAAVRAVEDDARALRLDHLLQHELLFLPHDAVVAAVIAVGDDVAGYHVLDERRQRDGRIGDVHHHRHVAGHVGRPARELHRLGRVLPDQVRSEAKLHADGEVRILLDRLRAALRIGIGKVRKLAAARRARDADRGQIDEGAHARAHVMIEHAAQAGEVG